MQSQEIKEIGERVKEFRLRRRFNLRDLAKKANTSASYLCSLSSLCHKDAHHDKYVLRKSRRASLVSKDGKKSLEFLTAVLDGNPLMEVAILTLEPGASFPDKHTHPGEEVILLNGR